MENKTVDCTFATVASTGEKPTAEIHAAGFKREDGLAMSAHIAGRALDVEQMIIAMVKTHAETAKKKGGDLAAATFIVQIGHALGEGAGDGALKLANKLLNPDFMEEKMREFMEKFKAELEEE